MDTNIKLKESLSELKRICKDEEIDIIDNSMEEYDCYISFNYIKNKTIFNKLFSLREKEYVFQFEKTGRNIHITISGKQDLYEDILEALKNNDLIFNDIKEIISFIEKYDHNDLMIVSYFNGVTYFYEITNNIYGHAFKYYNFIFDGIRYHYQVNNHDIFKETMKKINKDIEMYRKLMKDTDIVLEEEITSKNTYIQEIRELYSKKGDKELLIIFKEQKYYIVIKVGTNLYLFKYDNEQHIKNMMPELFQLYLEDCTNVYKEERQTCLGKGFYINVIDSKHKLFLYNIEENDLEYYISYIQILCKKTLKNNQFNEDCKIITEKVQNKSSHGFINIFILSLGVLIFSIFIFLVTLNFIK